MNRAADLPHSDDAEVDIWWGGYAGRAMVPSFLVCIVATACVIALAVYLDDAYNLPSDSARYAVYAIAGGFWTVQVLRWILRLVGVSYRVTTRRIYCWPSLFGSPYQPIDLAAVTRVGVEQTGLERLLGVGRVRITSKDAELVFFGLVQPRRVAVLVEHRAREEQLNRGCS